MKLKTFLAYPHLDNFRCDHTFVFSSKGNTYDEKINYDGTISLKNGNNFWDPDYNCLNVKCLISKDSISECVAVLNEIFPKGSKLRLVLTQSSKTSNSLMKSYSDPFDLRNLIDISVLIENPESTLSGIVDYKLEFILSDLPKKQTKGDLHKCSNIGSRVCVFDSILTIRCDGDGSSFPLFYERLSNSPLISLKLNTDDLDKNPFQSEYIRLSVNLDHKDCPKEFEEDDFRGVFHKYLFKLGLIVLFTEVSNNACYKDSWNKIKDSASNDFDRFSITESMKFIYNEFDLDGTSPNSLSESILNNIQV